MEENILKAIERTKQTGKFRESGFVPGVLYGDSITDSISIKFEEKALNKILNSFGSNAKIWIQYKEEKKFGFIKEVQRKPITGNVIHIDVQIVSKEHEIKRQIPIMYKGEGTLKVAQLQIQPYKSEISVIGKMELLPDTIYVDVSEKKLGDTITFSDLSLDASLKKEDEDTIYGMVINIKNQAEETDADSAEPEAEKSN